MHSILVIEDNYPDVVILKVYLEEAAFKTNFFHTTTLQEGLEIIKDNHIDLVLLDLSLADTAGFITLKKYLTEAPDVPVIVMTGMKNEVVGIQSVKAGALDFLIKGEFDSKSLVRSIKYGLQRWKKILEGKRKVDEMEEQVDKNKRVHQIAKIGCWEMDIVDRSMTWDEEMFNIFGFQPNSLNPTTSDYLKYVHFEDKNKVDVFFDKVIEGSEERHLVHKIIVNGTTTKRLLIHARVHIKGENGQISLIGTVQDITSKSEEKPISEEDVSLTSPALTGKHCPSFHPKITPDFIGMVNEMSANQGMIKGFWMDSIRELVDSYYKLMQFAIIHNAILKNSPIEVDLPILLKNTEKFINLLSDHKAHRLQITIKEEGMNFTFVDPNWVIQLILAFHLLSERQFADEPATALLFSFITQEHGEKVLQLNVSGQYKKIHHLYGFTEQTLLQQLSERNNDREEALHLLTILRIIHLLDCKYQVKQGPGYSLKFNIEIPIEELPSATHKSLLNGSERPTHVLIAEDQPINRINLKKMISSWNSNPVDIQLAENGKEALEIFDKVNVDLVLMDLEMPIMGGLEAASKIRRKSNIPIIGLSNNLTEEEEQMCKTAGFNVCLAKPLNQEELFNTMNSLLF